MARTLPVNAEFDIELGRLGKPQQLEALRHGIEAALAVAPGDTLSASQYPLLGFYFTFSPEQFLSYFVTPGRFVRYEVAGGKSLTVTVSLDRVSRVVETAGAAELAVTVELDADATSTLVETQTEVLPGSVENGGVARGAMRSMARMTRTTYEMRAVEAADVVSLSTFSRALRSALGL